MLIPYGGLHFADVRLFKHEHAKAGLAYTSAYSERQFAVEQRLMERQLRTFLAMRRSKLLFHGFLINPYAHAGYFKFAVQHAVIKYYVAVEFPIVVVGCAAVVRFAV